MIDWKKEAAKWQDEMVEVLSGWIQQKSVYDPDTIGPGAPFGEGVKNALDFIVKQAEKDGFDTVNDEGYACHIDYGTGNTLVGILGHADVVPEGEGWNDPPYSGAVKDGKVFGRGTQDDKGPIIACYYALKIIRDLKPPVSKKARIIIGGNEEREWKCVDHYFKTYPRPDYGFTPDGDFPLVFGEKEIQMYEFTGEYKDSDVISLKAGTAANSVADHATAIVALPLAKVQPLFNQFLAENKLEGNATEEGGNTRLDIKGVGAHASTPEEGVNAATFMLKFLKANTGNKMLAHFADVFASNDGEGMGVKFTGDKMGPLTANLGVINYENGKYQFVLDTRYPMEIDREKMFSSIEKAGTDVDWPAKLEKTAFKKGIYLDVESDLIKTLYKAYVDQTGDTTTKPYVIGGGSFARATDNVVCYGMIFPGSERLFHQKNEMVTVEDLVRGTAIYAQAIYELMK